jgi:hypothetical protein
MQSETAVIPALCGEDGAAWRIARYCVDHGVFVQGIPYAEGHCSAALL